MDRRNAHDMAQAVRSSQGRDSPPVAKKAVEEERPETHGRRRTVDELTDRLPRPQHVPPLPRPRQPAQRLAQRAVKTSYCCNGRQLIKSCDGAGGDDAHRNRWRRREEAGRRERAALVGLPRSRCRSREANGPRFGSSRMQKREPPPIMRPCRRRGRAHRAARGSPITLSCARPDYPTTAMELGALEGGIAIASDSRAPPRPHTVPRCRRARVCMHACPVIVCMPCMLGFRVNSRLTTRCHRRSWTSLRDRCNDGPSEHISRARSVCTHLDVPFSNG